MWVVHYRLRSWESSTDVFTSEEAAHDNIRSFFREACSCDFNDEDHLGTDGDIPTEIEDITEHLGDHGHEVDVETAVIHIPDPTPVTRALPDKMPPFKRVAAAYRFLCRLRRRHATDWFTRPRDQGIREAAFVLKQVCEALADFEYPAPPRDSRAIHLREEDR